MSDIKSLLDKLGQEADKTVSVYVPLCVHEVEFKHITVPQQKQIIKATLNGVKGNMLLPRVFNRIILENGPQGFMPSILDRQAILVQLRIASIGNAVVDDDGEETTIEFNLPENLTPSTGSVSEGTITVSLHAPDLQKDSVYYNMLENNNYDNAGDIVNDLYLYEAAKFITKIEVGDDSAEPTPKESIRLIEELPLSLNTKILDFIKELKKNDNEVLKLSNGKIATLNAKFFNTTEA